MLAAVSGYIDDNKVIVNENITNWQGKKVIVTILDSSWNDQPMSSNEEISATERRQRAADELAGLWKSHDDNDIPVDTVVRNMRRSRRFDI